MTAQHARILAVGLALTAIGYLLTVPVYATNTAARLRLLDVNRGAGLVLLVPIVVTTSPFCFERGTHRHDATMSAAAALTLACLIGSMSIGLHFVPATIALWIAAALREPASGAE